MCGPVALGIAAAASAAASLGGAYMSAKAQQSAANAMAQQNWTEQQAQAQGFLSRMATTQGQTTAQTNALLQEQADRNQIAMNMYQQEQAAQTQQQQILAAENQQAAQLQQTGANAGQTLLQQTSGPALQAAQAASAAQAVGLVSATPGGPGGPTAADPTNPTAPSANADDPALKQALATEAATAATNIRNYGAKVAAVQSYQAPLSAINTAVNQNAQGIMPAQAAYKLLSSGSNTLLFPTQVAYQNAQTIGQAQDLAAQARGQAAQAGAQLAYNDQTQLADLAQSDADVNAQNIAGQSEANAQYQQQLGNLVSGVGQLGMAVTGYATKKPVSSLFA